MYAAVQSLNRNTAHQQKEVASVKNRLYRFAFVILSFVSPVCSCVEIFFCVEREAVVPRGRNKNITPPLPHFFLSKKKICINFWCYTATSCPPTARAVGGWGITVFSLYNHKLPRNHGLSRDTAMLSPFTHTNTHTLWIHTMAHVITITLQFFFVFISLRCLPYSLGECSVSSLVSNDKAA